MKHHSGIRSASNHKTRASSPGFRARTRDEETRRLFLVEQTLEWVACASHIFIDFISLWLLCRADPGIRVHTRAWYEMRNEERRGGRKRQDKMYHDDPIMGQLRGGCGTSVDTSFRFASSFANITALFKDFLDYVDSVLFHRNPIFNSCVTFSRI